MNKKKKEEMRTLQDQLSSPEVKAVVTEEIVPAIKNIETTNSREIAKKREYIATIPGHMADLVSRVRAIRITSPEERIMCLKEERALLDEIALHLGYKDELLRSAAANAYADAVIATLPPEMDAIIKAFSGGNGLPGLLELGVITETDKKGMATIKVNGRIFQVNGGQAAKRADALKEALKKAMEKEVEKIRAKAKTTKEELIAGKPGLTLVNVPDEKEGKRFLGGGVLLVESNSKAVRPVEFLGHFQKIMTEIYEADVFISAASLRFDQLNLPELSPEKIRLCRIFHSILRRGLAAEFARQKSAAPAAPAKILVAADAQSVS